jgi:predicted NBD/HSP70 family sugar kinase
MIDDAAPAGTRELNRLHVLEALLGHPASSRAELGRRTGLSRATVSALLDELESARIVEQRPDERGDGDGPRPAGRPPLQVSLAPRAAFAVGLDLGHDHIRAAVCDLTGRAVAQESSRAEVDDAPAASLDLARALVARALRAADVPRERVLGVGMGVAAPVDPDSGTVHVAGILPGWDGVDPAAEMATRLGLEVQLENDANAGALGEHRFGAGRGARDMVYVRLSAGVGLGLILAGRPYRGGAGLAGELGHVAVADGGPICRCGNRGCLETVAGPPAVARLLERHRGGPVTVSRLLELVAAGDRGARRAVADAGVAVGDAIAAVVNVLNPELVVIGGELAGAGAVLLDPIRGAIERRAVPHAAATVRVTAGALGDQAEVLGAAALALARAPHALARVEKTR